MSALEFWLGSDMLKANNDGKALNDIRQVGKLIKASRENPQFVQQLRDAQERWKNLDPAVKAKLPPEAHQMPTQVQGLGDINSVVNPAGAMEDLRYKYPDNEDVQKASERFDTATRFQDPRAIDGVQQYADKYQEQNPAQADFANMAANQGMGDLAYKSAMDMSEGIGEAGSSRLSGSQGARLQWAKENPDAAAEIPKIVESFRGMLGNEFVDGALVLGKFDPIGSLEQIFMARRPTESRTATLRETQGLEGQMSATKAAGTVQGKEAAEQDILSGITVYGLEPIPGVRQDEALVRKVVGIKPDLDALEGLVGNLMGKYEKNGWQPLGKGAAEYEAITRQLQMLSKNQGFMNLGVLNGDDLRLLEEMISNPASFKDGALMARYGKDHMGVRLNSVKDLITMKADLTYNAHGLRRSKAGTMTPLGAPSKGESVGGNNAGSKTPTQISTAAEYDKLPSGAEYIDPNGKKRRKQ